MAPKLYYIDLSPPSRGCVLTARALGVDIELKVVNLPAGEHMTPAFLKINPQHTVPTLDDDGFVLWDSHAINIYLIEKYGSDDSLYPKDLQKRSLINQRLFFDAGVMQPRLGAIVSPIFREGAKTIPKDKADALVQGYGFLETFLENTPYVAGHNLTVADLNLAVSVSTANLLVPLAANRYPNITDWLNKMRSLPYWNEASQQGLDKAAAFFKSKLA